MWAIWLIPFGAISCGALVGDCIYIYIHACKQSHIDIITHIRILHHIAHSPAMSTMYTYTVGPLKLRSLNSSFEITHAQGVARALQRAWLIACGQKGRHGGTLGGLPWR